VKSLRSVKFHDLDGSKSPRFFPKSPWSPCCLLVKSLMSPTQLTISPYPSWGITGHHADLAMTGHQLAILGPGPGWNRTGWHPVTCHRSVTAPKWGLPKSWFPQTIQHSSMTWYWNLWGLGDPSWLIGNPKRFSSVLERVGGKSPFPHRAKGLFTAKEIMPNLVALSLGPGSLVQALWVRFGPKDGWVRSFEAMHGQIQQSRCQKACEQRWQCSQRMPSHSHLCRRPSAGKYD
jgi:hypothetical protein